MFGALAARAPDLVLPGTDLIRPDSVVLLQTNPAFVAAFMAGLNSAMAEELLWRGFPLQRRASLFTRFWDFRGQGTGSEDIAPIGDWHPDESLWDAGSGETPADNLVLAVRGDLLGRHPRTLVYAIRAVRDQSGRPVLGDETAAGGLVDPAFTGFIEPDIRLFGFALKAAEVRSSAASPGWFFAFQEQITEARFGLASGQPLPLSGTAADAAAQTLRPAARVAVHADHLLPEP
jgi:hypothetical protein